MKIAVLSDIHGNIFGLKKCIELSEKENINHYIFCGDYISDIPQSHNVIKYLKELNKKYNCYFVRGNREDYIIDYLNTPNKNWSLENRNGPMFCTLNELDEGDIEFINKLPESLEINIKEISSIFVTHKPCSITNNYKYVLYGHTHKPEYYTNQNINYINPGSVGLGLSNNFCSEFAILNIENDQENIKFIKIKQEITPIIQSIINSQLPKTSIRWDSILIKTIEDNIDYSEIYIKKVIENAKLKNINNLDDIPIDIWEKTRNEIFNFK